MRLIQLSKTAYVNPEKVIMIQQESDYIRGGLWKERVIVYLEGIQTEVFEENRTYTDSLFVESMFSLEETVGMVKNESFSN
ncbi:MAG: hypothetical protein WC623_23995 [Pedobacter sp.]|uniref:hypothetical protein n=1 Tax=Pedobacter sp. TaxID=1411316 RepID=UPI00356B26F3